jgi:hypothetical protein
MSSPRAAGAHPQPSAAGGWTVVDGGLGLVREEQASDNRHRQRQVEAEHPLNQVHPPVELGFDAKPVERRASSDALCESVFVCGDLLGRLAGFSGDAPASISAWAPSCNAKGLSNRTRDA